MAKVPRSGRVKTRLVPPLTYDQASELCGSFLRDVAAAVLSAAAAGPSPAIRGVAAYLPVGDEAGFEGLLPESFLLVRPENPVARSDRPLDESRDEGEAIGARGEHS
jgi:hypothetical protein